MGTEADDIMIKYLDFEMGNDDEIKENTLPTDHVFCEFGNIARQIRTSKNKVNRECETKNTNNHLTSKSKKTNFKESFKSNKKTACHTKYLTEELLDNSEVILYVKYLIQLTIQIDSLLSSLSQSIQLLKNHDIFKKRLIASYFISWIVSFWKYPLL
ncbi:hypothetical protein AAG747_17585 [Rapidithrix thailandica]|uniref:Uncharacterized protein n=1 Tax=Rapidithrix thailandica TaxID=413964 RepID=A0AAW9SD57_9BACT